MGLFGRKSMGDRRAEGMASLEMIGQGKGLTGRLTKALMGDEFTELARQASDSIKASDHVHQLLASGAPTTVGTVLSMADTGQLINHDPLVDLAVQLGAQQLTIRALVSKIAVPRPGDPVLLVQDPQTRGYWYAGLAPNR